ncbi:MAG: beta-ketoacyl-[acyl-carrier-protein] synthase family protein [Bacteroidales bacterium]|nr:beta-ketoacyl-[acyl-carrier-protein] synthase family protein [Bacteroidota bacterium]MBL6949797.1 beta-ketoacyl-[acyl-carrier-protein] synthase family protein [Bacteroidales bacterium]
MSKRVFITGTGIISAIGNNVSEVFTSLQSATSGIGEITLFPTVHAGIIPVAEVKMTTEQLLDCIGFHGSHEFTRTSLLGMIAAREAIEAAGITDIGSCKTGLLSANSVGGMNRSESFYKEFLEDRATGRLRDIVNHDCGDSTERIARYTGIKDFISTISTACSSSANTIMFGADLIRSGKLDRVIAGGTDSITKFTLNGFNTLMILDKNGCRPFDENRAGLTLGEGAAYVVLEPEEVIVKEGITPLAELTGYGNANDAYHQTASSPEGTGAYMAMKKALEKGKLPASEIDYINVHGTGTENNDLSEGLALERIFVDQIPPFSSTKTYTGHALGAAGAVEAVISILSLQHGMIFPNLNWNAPMKELKIRPVTEIRKGLRIAHALSNSFGFGGNNSTVIISSCG